MGQPTTEPDAGSELVRARVRLRVLSDVTRRFAEVTTHYERLLESVAHSLAEVIRDSCVVFLLDEGGETMSAVSMHAADPAAFATMRESYGDRKVRLADHEVMAELVKSGKSLLVPRFAQRGQSGSEQERWEQKVGLHSVLLVPLQVQGSSIGLVTLARFRGSPAFDQSDLDLTQSLADHAGLAIENSRLFVAAETARRSAEQAREAVRRSEVAQRQFFASSPVPSFVVDAESLRMLAANEAALTLYGYSMDEFLALGLQDLRPAEERQELLRRLEVAGKGDTRGLARHMRKDGTLIHVEGGSHLATFDGRPARFIVLSDQTARVKAELERDQVEQRLRRTLDDMQEGYTIMDSDLRYVYMNRAGAEQTHLTREQLIGHTPMELYPGFEGSKIHLALKRAVDEGTRQSIEEELMHQDGELGYFELNIQPVPEGLVVLSIDQTDRRRAEKRRDSLEDQLRQAQKMEAVGRLAGGIAHDFNNVLSIILGYGEDVLAALKPVDPLREDMQEILAAANRAGELTRQLLMFSRQQVLEPKVMDLNEVLVTMERMLGRLLGEQLELVILPDPSLGRIRADRGNLEQVIVNLAVNARDAMPNGGRLIIETANVTIDEDFVRQHVGSKPGEYVFLGVTDTGVGMDPVTRARIFEPFFSTKELGKGTGLGLSTVFGIVQQSGGGIWVYSEPGHGSAFKVYLPRVDAALDPRPPTIAPAALLGTETLLLVEDEPPVREVARRILERHGYRVLVAETAADALAISDEHGQGIDLLLTDVVMPRISGAELAAQLHARRPGLKVLFMSGYTDGSIGAHNVLQQGAAFLQKPFTSESLARKVRAVVDGV